MKTLLDASESLHVFNATFIQPSICPSNLIISKNSIRFELNSVVSTKELTEFNNKTELNGLYIWHRFKQSHNR